MPLLNLERKLCLNDIAVPLRSHTADFDDIHKVTESGDEEMQNFSIVDLKSNANVYWMMRAFKLNHKFWKSHSRDLPLIQELK